MRWGRVVMGANWKKVKKDIKVKILYLVVILIVLVIGYLVASGIYNHIIEQQTTMLP